jgi:glycosyltransferase involved in cell wall biosynthesis
MVKILYIITGLTTGGAEMMLYKVLSRLDREKFAPTVISLIDRGVFAERFEALGIPVHTIGLKQGIPTPGGLWRLIKLIDRLQPDLIQGWMYHANLAAQLANLFARRKVPICWSIHHSIDSLAAEKFRVASIIRITIWASHYVDAVAFSSQRSQKQHENLGYERSNSHLINDSFDVSKYQPLPAAKQQLAQALNLAEDSFLIGSIARYHPMKDHGSLLKAAAIIAPDFPLVNFVLIGPFVNEQSPALVSLIKDLNLSDRVHLLGERQDVPQLIAGFDIFTSSSAFGEAFPNVIGEAMSCNVPCVVTNVGDSAYIVGDVGTVVPPKNPAALAEAWREIINLDTTTRHALGIKARERIIREFSLDSENSATRKYENLYTKLLEQKA